MAAVTCREVMLAIVQLAHMLTAQCATMKLLPGEQHAII